MTIGLAWTPYGGDVLVVEAVSNPGRGLPLTGQMGDVMQESAGIAYTFARQTTPRSWASTPSGGTSGTSISTFRPAQSGKTGRAPASRWQPRSSRSRPAGRSRPRIGMTGELSLIGQVLPIGGLKEKTIAARRHNLKHIIMPAKNERDLDEIPEKTRKGITFHPAETMDEVLGVIFGR